MSSLPAVSDSPSPLHPPPSPLPSLQNPSSPFIQPQHPSQSENRNWTEAEHIRYILFLENNRSKIKSKLIRRSNLFYKDMAAFVQTKTPVQCRGHHQKYEAKHKFPHIIIRAEKHKLDQTLYASIKYSLSHLPTPSQSHITQPVDRRPSVVSQKGSGSTSVRCESVGCQTEIEGTGVVLLPSERLQQYYQWAEWCRREQMRQGEEIVQWNAMYLPWGNYPLPF